ncbi:MAG: hypothetical protein AB7J13_02270, partial [Pyrinomonadaceae bacterium]
MQYCKSDPDYLLGWKIGTGYEIFFRDAAEDYDYVIPPSFECGGYDFYYLTDARYFKPMLRMPDGSEHEMRIEGEFPTYPTSSRDHMKGYYTEPANGFSSPVRFYTIDGSFLTVIYRPEPDPIRWTIYTKDGTRIEQSAQGQRTIDTNGNSILLGFDAVGNYSFSRDEQTGREIRWSASTYSGQGATKVEYQSVGGVWQTVWVVWGLTTVKGKVYTRTGWDPNAGKSGQGEVCSAYVTMPDTPLDVVREIVFPQTELGVNAPRYLFEYNSDTTVQTTTNSDYYCGVFYPAYTRFAST